MKQPFLTLTLIAGCIIIAALALFVGPGDINLSNLVNGLSETQSTILFQLRLPRILLAILAGASLGLSGALMQTYFRNPLAEPYITGVSAGGALGAVAGFSIGLSGAIPVAVSAMLGACLVTGALLFFALNNRVQSSMVILLLGMALGTFCGAVVWFLLLRGGPGGTDQALAWLLGRVSTVGYTEILVMAPVTIAGLVLAMLLSPALDALLMGEEKAVTLGIDLRTARVRILGLASVLAAVCVAFCGVVAFVGLIVPHMARIFTGGLHARLLPVCAAGGAVLVLIFDILSRTVDPPREIPLTILTSLVGAPFFIFVLGRMRQVAV